MERGSDTLSPAAALSALQWWAEAGVDTFVDETPRDWLRPKAERPDPARKVSKAVAEEPVSEPDDQLPGQLDLFHAYLASSERLSFAAPSAPRICPSGDPGSGLMILTDMPSSEDCADGILISGEAGRLFDRMLAAIGRTRETIYLAALSCLRSPDGRLTSASAQQCAALARHHLGLVAPKAVLLLGDACSRALLGLGMAEARGRWHDIPTHAGPVKTLVTIAPNYLLSQPAAKAYAWADLQLLIHEVTR
ncbi:uracil-DNA glycosylase [Sphingosinicella rhizophila]|uniref:Uracil-DNA glycosylase n=1 Tax=Sphingosinicella rhizophila TaxID=3050082 RepID=A0ABU3Q275_9SPHN|nr:uracil-DNA glycosylase [Sphingosinicella sp. GR2756]MDT9597525.1 uracil-DNA glycosylase [Sphingosinicella sp. GR2756]